MPLVINGQTVDEETIYQEFEAIKSAAQRQPNAPSCCERDDEFMAGARQNVVARVLLTQEAQRRNVTVPADEVDRTLEDLKKQHGGEDWFYMTFNTTREHEGELKENLEKNLCVQRLIEQLCAPMPEPDDAEIHRYYQEHLDLFMAPEQVHACHILKSLDHGADRATVFAQLRDVRRQLLDGGDFAALCKEHSDQPDEGGDLGFFPRGELVEEFESVVFSLEPGELSPVFLTPFGYHLAIVQERKAAAPYPLDEIRDAVKQHMTTQRRDEHVKAYVQELKSGAVIEDISEDAGEEQAQQPSAADEDGGQ